MGRKVIAIWLSLILMVSVVVIVDVSMDISLNVGGTTLYVNTTGSGGAYTSIQDAIIDSDDGDTVYVYNGTYYENVRVNKTINLIGEDRNTTIIDGGGIGDVVRVVEDWVNITEFSITGGGPDWYDAGIELYSVQFSSIISCNISNCNYGILLQYSNNNTLYDNTCTSISGYGITLISTSNSNTITFNTVVGPGPIPSYDNMVIGDFSTSNIITNNYCSNGWDGIYVVVNCNFNLIHNNTFTQNRNGIVPGGDSNIFSNNNIYNNEYGIFANGGGELNIVKYNNISQNDYGIYFHQMDDNTVFHNNFVNNVDQAYDDGINYWNSGYPIGGNYWSDYIGNDNFKGPYQNIPGSDGIGDTPYIIDSDSQDNYPLMEPYSYKPLENYTILKQGWNLISIPLIQEDQNPIKVLEMIDGWYDAVQWFDVADGVDPWKHYKVGKSYGNDLSQINETMGFWIHIIQPGDTIFIYNGTTPTSNQTIQLHTGWNMVGYPSLTSYNRTEGLNNLTFYQEVDLIQWYNAQTKTWHDLDENDYFIPGRGYWIHAKAECEWEVTL